MPRQKIFDLTDEEWTEAHKILNKHLQNFEEPPLKFFGDMAKTYKTAHESARVRDQPWPFSYLTWLQVWPMVPDCAPRSTTATNLKPRTKTTDDYQHLRDRNNHPKSRPVVCPDGIVYPSAALAADTHKRTRVCIAQRCRTGWGGWHYADEKEKRVLKGKL